MTKSIPLWKTLFLAIVLLAVTSLPAWAAETTPSLSQEEIAAAKARLAELNKQDYLSEMFRTVAKLVKPAVVEIHVAKWVKEPEMPDMEEFMRRFFGDDVPFEFRYRTPTPSPQMPQPKLRQYQMRGLGSGVVVDAKNGYVLTNYHVVAGADDPNKVKDQVKIVLADNREFKAQWVRSDPQTDLAVIKIDANDLVEAPLGDSDKAEVGDWVLAIGAPQRLPETVTSGIISAKGRTTGVGPVYQSFIQTDAAINRGNSGGPLVNMRGEVIGINNSIATVSGGNEGIGFAIPSNMAKGVMQQLVEKGKVTRGYLGVAIQDIDSRGLAQSLGLPDMQGALISQVMKDTPADKAGLKDGDVIVKVDGQTVASANELRNTVARIAPGTAVKLEIYRDGKKQTVEVIVAAQPKVLAQAGMREEESETPAEATTNRFGLKVATLTEEMARQANYKAPLEGVIITDVADGSDAREQGLRPGMVILDVQGKKVETAEEFEQAISGEAAAKGVRLRLTDPGGGRRYFFIQPMEKQPAEKQPAEKQPAEKAK
jgi:serine protease Do